MRTTHLRRLALQPSPIAPDSEEALSPSLSSEAVEQIQNAALEALKERNGRGLEIGGLLLAKAPPTQAQLLVDGVTFVPCEYRYGPSYDLSPADLRILKARAAETRQHPENTVAGYFRSCLDEPFTFASYDVAIIREFLPESQFLVIVKPLADGRLNVRVFQPDEDLDWTVCGEFDVPAKGRESRTARAAANPTAVFSGKPTSVAADQNRVTFEHNMARADAQIDEPSLSSRKAVAHRQIRNVAAAGLIIAGLTGVAAWTYDSLQSEPAPRVASALEAVVAEPPLQQSSAPDRRPESPPVLNPESLLLPLPLKRPAKPPVSSTPAVRKFVAPPENHARAVRTVAANSLVPPSIESPLPVSAPVVQSPEFHPPVAVSPLKPEVSTSLGPAEQKGYEPPQAIRQIFPDTNPIGSSVVFGPTNVSVRVEIDAEGRVISAQLDTPVAKPHQLLATQALIAARKWTFEPARAGGTKVASSHVILFRFR